MSALLFDGTNSYTEVDDNSVFSPATTGSMTVSMWIRPDVNDFPITSASGDGEYVNLLGKAEYNSPNYGEWEFRMYNLNSPTRPNRISFYIFNGTMGLGVGSYFQDAITAGSWIHVVGMVNGTNTFIFKNGAQRDTDNYISTIAPADTAAPLRFGHVETSGDPGYFLGAIDDIRIYNYALGTQEVADIYNGSPTSTGLVANWPVNEGVGTKTTDSVSSYDAIFKGNTTWTTGRNDSSVRSTANTRGGVSATVTASGRLTASGRITY